MRAARYAACAVAASAINLSVQWGILSVDTSGRGLAAALLAGTACGLVAKYVLDKHLVFEASAVGPVSEARRFSLYTATGVVTTALFWAVEAAAHAVFGSAAAVTFGGAVGLALGYVLKFALDRRFVFSEAAR
jgi:putative flippase GtrA